MQRLLIKALAKEFVEEERGHVAELKKWIAAHKAGKPLPVDQLYLMAGPTL